MRPRQFHVLLRDILSLDGWLALSQLWYVPNIHLYLPVKFLRRRSQLRRSPLFHRGYLNLWQAYNPYEINALMATGNAPPVCPLWSGTDKCLIKTNIPLTAGIVLIVKVSPLTGDAHAAVGIVK